MTPSNREFAADLRAATAELADAVAAVAWLRTFAMAALCDPRTPPEEVAAIDRSLAVLRNAMPGIDAAVDKARCEYADRFGEYRPSSFQLN